MDTKHECAGNSSEASATSSNVEECFICTICMLNLSQPVSSICGQRFCKKCLVDWLSKQDKKNAINNKNSTEADYTKLHISGSPEQSGGRLFWKINSFKEIKERLMNNENIYSPTFHTKSGYRFKMRIKVREQTKTLAIFLHLVKGHNDETLKWPFAGEITITLVQPTLCAFNRTSVIQTDGSRAFIRPQSDINPLGIGFKNTVTIDDLHEDGYVRNDELLILCQIKED